MATSISTWTFEPFSLVSRSNYFRHSHQEPDMEIQGSQFSPIFARNGIQNAFHHVNVADQVFSRRKHIRSSGHLFRPAVGSISPEQHFLIWIYRIAHGHHRNNGWNKDRRLFTNGNKDGDFHTNFKINGIYTFIYFGKNMNATLNSMQMTVSTDSNASHRKFECLKDMYFVQEIIIPTRPSLPARATTTTCWRRPILKLTFSNNVPSDHWHFETDCVKQQKQELPRVAQSLINPEGTLPYAYLLPKPSKDFEKARPIISYMLSWNAKLGQVIGTIVYELCRSIFGDLQLDRTVQTIITDIQRQFDQIPADVELNLQQQDLSGFFNSVPHARMIDAVTFAVNHYSYEHGISLDSTLSTSIAQEDRTQRIFRGRFRQAGRRYMNIKLSEIPTMVIFLLQHSYLTVGNYVFRQIQGASMGSQFAPALCGLVAAFQEYCFFKAFQGMNTFNRLLHNSRYVDNRVMMHFPEWRQQQPWNIFTKLDFYNSPILQEEVDDSEILGCHISTETTQHHHSPTTGLGNIEKWTQPRL